MLSKGNYITLQIQNQSLKFYLFIVQLILRIAPNVASNEIENLVTAGLLK